MTENLRAMCLARPSCVIEAKHRTVFQRASFPLRFFFKKKKDLFPCQRVHVCKCAQMHALKGNLLDTVLPKFHLETVLEVRTVSFHII